jgi:hypothetical protein
MTGSAENYVIACFIIRRIWGYNEECSRLGCDSVCFAWLTLRQFSRNQYVPPKFRRTSAALAGVQSQKIALFEVGSAFFQLQGTFRAPLVQYISIPWVKMHPLPSWHQRHLLKTVFIVILASACLGRQWNLYVFCGLLQNAKTETPTASAKHSPVAARNSQHRVPQGSQYRGFHALPHCPQRKQYRGRMFLRNASDITG